MWKWFCYIILGFYKIEVTFRKKSGVFISSKQLGLLTNVYK